MKKKKVKRLYSVRINLFITGFMFLLLLLTNLISNSLFAFLHRNTLPPARPGNPLYPFLVQNACFSIVVGCLLTFLFSHWLLSPLHTLIRAIRGVSEGNFKTKLQIRYPREFRELSRQFNQMTEELSSTELLRSDFVNNFSHEFKTPIVSILGFAKLLKKENLETEERNEYLDIIIEESNRLASLSSGILNLSKLEKTSLLLDLQTYNISEQIRVAITQLASQWLEKNLSLQLHLDEIDLTGNELLLKEVWLNLLDNAIKFSPKNRTITVFAKADESSALFSIQDQGIGMAREVQKHIFDKFYQGDPSHSIQGNGLGLPLAKRIVELHHGSIQVQSSPEKGSTFTVVLPLRQSQETSV